MQQPESNKLTKWLNKLQRESWQLELVISGFAIFLMIGALEALNNYGRDIAIISQGLGNVAELLQLGYGILMGTCFFLLINLVLHVLLRGIWISTIGLRYVSGDIDFDSLRLAPKFDRLLRKKVGSFDQYILKLENLCSVVFAFTFLIVFMLFAVGMHLGFIVLVVNVLINNVIGGLSENVADVLSIFFLVIMVLGGLLYFIDFLTLGFIKRIKWLSHVYLPFYRLNSAITLSFLYRPIYYNLIDNKFGRRVGILLLPYVIIVLTLFFQKVYSHVWYPENPGTTAMVNAHYDDLRDEEALITSGSIPSRYVDKGFLQVFIAYLPKNDDRVLKLLCPDFEPFHEPGIGSHLKFSISGNEKEPDPDTPEEALQCFSKLYEVRVNDSLYQDHLFRFYRHPNFNEYGVVTVLDINGLSRGEHVLEVKKKDRFVSNSRDTLAGSAFMQVPFWKE